MKSARYIFIFFLIHTYSVSLSQSVEITVKVVQAFSPQAKLYHYANNNFSVVDSSLQYAQGMYRFNLGPGYARGIYKVEVGKSIKFNVVVNDEPIIDINTVVFAPEDSLKSVFSRENNLYWQFQKQKKAYTQQNWLINSLLEYYAENSMVYKVLTDERKRLDESLFQFGNNLVLSNPKLLASKYIMLEQKPVADDNSKDIANLWWADIDLKNPLILNSPYLKERVWSYLELFFSDTLDKEEQDLSFIRGINDLFSNKMDFNVKCALREILVDGFENTDYLDVFEYLHYESFGGMTPFRDKKSKFKDKQSPRVKVGDRAYDFSITQSTGESKLISEVNAEYKLLFFWSSWCPHCIESIPKIQNIHNRYKSYNLEVIAIALDDEPSVWRHYIQKFNLDWINIREPYYPESELFIKYDVHETPKMFLISNDMKILSRPSTERQLENKLKRLTR
jgi:thiol-disulfide isomerase/thioredoxin